VRDSTTWNTKSLRADKSRPSAKNPKPDALIVAVVKPEKV
jgi:hypothetical protein